MAISIDLKQPISHRFEVRKWYLQEEEILLNETGKVADGKPLRRIAVAACVKNPYASLSYSADLSAIIDHSPELGLEIGRRILNALDGEPFESYGKACVVGMGGEQEHGNAFLTAFMMDPLRELLGGGLAWVSSTGKRSAAAATIDIPLAHRNALYVRSHYDTVSASFADAPAADEVLVIIVVATRGRLHARLGGVAATQIEGKDGLR